MRSNYALFTVQAVCSETCKDSVTYRSYPRIFYLQLHLFKHVLHVFKNSVSFMLTEESDKCVLTRLKTQESISWSLHTKYMYMPQEMKTGELVAALDLFWFVRQFTHRNIGIITMLRSNHTILHKSFCSHSNRRHKNTTLQGKVKISHRTWLYKTPI